MKSSIFVKKTFAAAADVVWVAAQFRLFIMIITAHTHTKVCLGILFVVLFFPRSFLLVFHLLVVFTD
jgi:hypothetical protein